MFIDNRGSIDWSIVSLRLLYVFFLSLLFLYARNVRNKQVRLPPGPPGDPFIGHVRQVPLEGSFKIFASWRKVFGKSYAIV